MNAYAVILAGGKGERFWPASRKNHPKQLLSIGTERSMIEDSVERIMPLIPLERILIVTNQVLIPKMEKLLPKVPKANILGEPLGRNTAPAIGWAAVEVQAKDPEGVMVVLTADHIIKEEERFREILRAGVEIAERKSVLLTIGIKPTRPETGYGHIKPERKICQVGKRKDIAVFKVERFVEKPDLERAREYTEEGYLWNSGMFIWRASSILGNMKEHLPSLYQGLTRIKESIGTSQARDVVEEVYRNIEGESIDYGIMEKAEEVYVLQGDFPWNDVGSWAALDEVCAKNGENNVVKGKTIGIDSKNCIIMGKDRLIATVGVRDLIVVDTQDAVLICPKNRAQEVKKLVKKLHEEGLGEYT